MVSSAECASDDRTESATARAAALASACTTTVMTLLCGRDRAPLATLAQALSSTGHDEFTTRALREGDGEARGSRT